MTGIMGAGSLFAEGALYESAYEDTNDAPRHSCIGGLFVNGPPLRGEEEQHYEGFGDGFAAAPVFVYS